MRRKATLFQDLFIFILLRNSLFGVDKFPNLRYNIVIRKYRKETKMVDFGTAVDQAIKGNIVTLTWWNGNSKEFFFASPEQAQEFFTFVDSCRG